MDRHPINESAAQTSLWATFSGLGPEDNIQVGFHLEVFQEEVNRGNAWYPHMVVERTGKSIPDEGAAAMEDLARIHSEGVADAQVLPMVRYFGIDRARDYSALPGAALKKLCWAFNQSRVSGYAKSLEDDLDIASLLVWCSWVCNVTPGTDVTPEEAVRYDTLRKALWAVLDNTVGALSGWSELMFDKQVEGSLLLKHRDGRIFPIEMVGGGVTQLALTVADLVRRATTLNPQFGALASLLTPGIVLIDNLEMRLSPTWQASIIDLLRSAFPRIQFIVTSASPLLLENSNAKYVIQLDR